MNPVTTDLAFMEMVPHLADAEAVQASERILAESRRLYVDEQGDVEGVQALMREGFGIPVVAQAYRRIFRADQSRVGWIALQNATATGEAELVVLTNPGLWQRKSVTWVAQWIFLGLKVRRLVLRIPERDSKSQDYARRLGFRFEGRAREYFPNGQDASVWVMFARDCRWLRDGGPQ